MDSNIFYVGGNAIKMLTSRALSAQEIRHLLGKFGEIKQVISHEDFQLIYFASEKDAKRCIQQFQYESAIR